MCEKQDDLNKWMCDGEVVEKMRGAINHFTFPTIIQIFSGCNMYKGIRSATAIHEAYCLCKTEERGVEMSLLNHNLRRDQRS